MSQILTKGISSSDSVLAQSFGAISTTTETAPNAFTPRLIDFDYLLPKREESLLDHVIDTYASVLSTPLPAEHFQVIKEPPSDEDIAFVDRMREKQLQAFYVMNPEALSVS